MHFLRLIRPVNLLVIALTMYAVRVFVMLAWGNIHDIARPDEVTDFFLLVVSTVMIAAGGNIINDYFDVKADRVNKPDRLIITRHIKPRWAILSHWMLNLVAFLIACYLSWRYETFWYVFVHLLSINALWFYSMYFKRRFLIGNLIIAGLTALVPILCGIHFFIQNQDATRRALLSEFMYKNQPEWFVELYNGGLFIYVLAAFALSLNFVREIIKDIEDIPGDQLLRAKTLPIVLGPERTRWIAVALLGCIGIAGVLAITQWPVEADTKFLAAFAPALLIFICILYSLTTLLFTLEKPALKRADFSLKIAMMVGCCIPYYWYFIL